MTIAGRYAAFLRRLADAIDGRPEWERPRWLELRECCVYAGHFPDGPCPSSICQYPLCVGTEAEKDAARAEFGMTKPPHICQPRYMSGDPMPCVDKANCPRERNK